MQKGHVPKSRGIHAALECGQPETFNHPSSVHYAPARTLVGEVGDQLDYQKLNRRENGNQRIRQDKTQQRSVGPCS
jgi:hypothetical protein